MGFNLNGVSRMGVERVNQFALVIYIADPLARFLDDLRRELVAGCLPRATVTVLPPRQLPAVDRAIQQAQALMPDFAPFAVEIEQIEVFPRTSVIFLGVGRGTEELLAMHQALNTGALAFDEPFEYHPHITLAQDFDAAELPRLKDLACERWNACRGPPTFRPESAAFV